MDSHMSIARQYDARYCRPYAFRDNIHIGTEDGIRGGWVCAQKEREAGGSRQPYLIEALTHVEETNAARDMSASRHVSISPGIHCRHHATSPHLTHLYVIILPIPLNDGLVRTLLSIQTLAGLQEESAACHWHAWYVLLIQRAHMSSIIAYMVGLPTTKANPVLHNPTSLFVNPFPLWHEQVFTLE